MARSKGAAAALDFFVWGSGHGYLGMRKVAGFPWVVFTMVFGVYVLITAALEASLAFYSCSIFVGCQFNTGGALAWDIIPFLLIGGFMVLDLMRKGMLAAPGRLATMVGQSSSQATAPAMAGGMACPFCGTAVTAADAFCPSCGARVQQAAAAGAAAPMVAPAGGRVCNSCGTTNPAGYAFCKRCGARLA